jgi:hypothetical protein
LSRQLLIVVQLPVSEDHAAKHVVGGDREHVPAEANMPN